MTTTNLLILIGVIGAAYAYLRPKARISQRVLDEHLIEETRKQLKKLKEETTIAGATADEKLKAYNDKYRNNNVVPINGDSGESQ